jgi:long-chain acyl-CoA synthetase
MLESANTSDNRLKLKRPQTAKKYRAVLDEMYTEAEAQSSARAKL